jgi:hypothetical protein
MYELQKYYMQCMDHLLVMYETQSDITIGDAPTNTTLMDYVRRWCIKLICDIYLSLKITQGNKLPNGKFN